jgi:predicted phage tail protein
MLPRLFLVRRERRVPARPAADDARRHNSVANGYAQGFPVPVPFNEMSPGNLFPQNIF